MGVLTIDLMQQHYLPCSIVPHGQQVHLSPLYDILDHAICITNHIYSESLSSGDGNNQQRHIKRQRHRDRDKYKVLQRPNVCYIFQKQRVQGF